MKSKLIPISYTIGILKPHLALKEDKVNEVMEALDKNNFEVFHSKRKILAREEILNLFYPYRNAAFFEHINEHLLSAESLIFILVNKVESVYDEQKEEDVKLESPIVRWKRLIGDKDPAEAKIKDPNSLRAKYGVDLIKNAFHGSDDAKAANKERDVFLFPVPERPPEFQYIKTKITIESIMKFLFPPNLEHSNTTGRLDLLAMYGPIVCYHSVDSCFCKNCVQFNKIKKILSVKTAKIQLEEAIREKQANERKRLGMTADIVSIFQQFQQLKQRAFHQEKHLANQLRVKNSLQVRRDFLKNRI